MTQEEKERMLQNAEAMKAYAEGKKIQARSIKKGINTWTDYVGDNPSWNFFECEYRPKPTPKVVPFTYEDREEIMKNPWVKVNADFFFITGIYEDSVYIDGTFYSYDDLLKHFFFFDGTPYGKKVE